MGELLAADSMSSWSCRRSDSLLVIQVPFRPRITWRIQVQPCMRCMKSLALETAQSPVLRSSVSSGWLDSRASCSYPIARVDSSCIKWVYPDSLELLQKVPYDGVNIRIQDPRRACIVHLQRSRTAVGTHWQNQSGSNEMQQRMPHYIGKATLSQLQSSWRESVWSKHSGWYLP